VAAVVALILLLGVTGISIMMRILRLDDRWFAARALAENVKSAVWRYVMKSAPETPEAQRGSDDEFLAGLREIRRRFPERATKTAAYLQGNEDITQWMKAVRKQSFQQKLDLFLERRLGDQLSWYTRKARENAILETQWMIGIIVLELVAVLAAALNALLLLRFNVVPGLAASASGLVGWIRTKRFSDLANSYTVAAEDLRQLRARADSVQDEASLAALVNDVETAVSREHSMWMARRGS
jgi:hypothetical protein